MKKMKRLISVLLVFAMLLLMMPISAFAAELPDDSANVAEVVNGGIPEEETRETEPEPIDNEGFPEHVIILPKGTEYAFSEDEKTIRLPVLDQKLSAGDTFVLYIGDFPAAYIAEDVAVDEGGMSVKVKKAPEEVYANVDIDAALDIEDSIVIINEEEGVSGGIEGDTLLLSSSGNTETTGSISISLSKFRIDQPENGSPTLSVRYKIETKGDIKWTLDQELAQIRFLGIGTFVVALDVEAAATATLIQEGTFEFSLDSDASEGGAITKTEYSNISDASGEGELKIALKMAVGVDLFVGEAKLLNATAGVAGKVKTESVQKENRWHTHTDVECYFFMSVGIVTCEMGAQIPVHVKRFCDYRCSDPVKDPEYTFEVAAGQGDILKVNTDDLEALLALLPRMLCGNQTITEYTELDKSCSVEAGCTLTIAEGQTLVVNGGMEQRGTVKLERGANLIVRGDYLHGAGTLTLGEDSNLIVDGNYTIKNDFRNLLSGGEIKISYEGKVEVKDGEEAELSTEGKEHYEVCTLRLKPTILKIYQGANMTVSGNLNQNGGDIEGGYYTKKCTITVGKEGDKNSGNYEQTGGSLELDDAFDVLIHGNYSLSGGEVDLSHNQNGSGAEFEVAGDYSQSGETSATFYCDLTVNGKIKLCDSAKLTQGIFTMTLGGDVFQVEDSTICAKTVLFRNGHTHIVYFETPENSNFRTIICENPERDKIDVQHGISEFHLGSNVEIVGDLRLVSGECEMRFQGNGLTVRGDLIQDGGSLGSIIGSGESVQLAVDGDYVIAEGLLWANGGTISVGGDFRMQGYDAAANAVSDSEPSVGAFHAEDMIMTVGGSVVVYCNSTRGFRFGGSTKDAKLTIKGDMIQRNYEGSDTPFELMSNCELIFSGENHPQTICFETEPELSIGIGQRLVVINRNPAGLIWGDNTEKLKALLQQDDTTSDPSCEHEYTYLDNKCEASCTEEGYTGDTVCEDCGQVIAYGKVIPVVEHNVVIQEAIAPSCTENGMTEGACCSSCKEVITEQEVVPATGHKFTEGVCSVCGTRDPDWTGPIEPSDPEEVDVFRLAGSNRYETAFLVADQMKVNLGIEKFDTVIVASGTNFADALSGSYLAGVKKAPILLGSTSDSINNQVKDYIRNNLNPGGTVYILGGESTVPASIETGLDGFTVTRLMGNDRFGTNLAILAEAGVGDKPILVCTGKSFADSLSASATELPILLVDKSLAENQKTFLASLNGNEIYVIGGESTVSGAMQEQLSEYGTIERVQGADRFETSIAIAKRFFHKPETAVVAYAWNFPDGLCGGPLAVTLDAPLILTMDKYETAAAEYIQDEVIRNGVILGGETLISRDAVNTIFN